MIYMAMLVITRCYITRWYSMDNSFPGASRGSRPSFEGAKRVPARRDRDWAKRRSKRGRALIHGEHGEDPESEDDFPIFIPYHSHSYGK